MRLLKRTALITCLGVMILVLAPTVSQAREAARHRGGLGGVNWIWSPEPRVDQPWHDYFTPYWAEPGARYFHKPFELPAGSIESAVLLVAVDNFGRLYVNGRHVGSTEVASGESVEDNRIDTRKRDLSIAIFDVTDFLRPGENVLAVEAASGLEKRPGSEALPLSKADFGGEPGPAGLAAYLSVVFADGEQQEILSDVDWLCADSVSGVAWREAMVPGAGWQAAVRLGPMGISPWRLVEGSRVVPPENWPEFVAPGHEREMALLRELHVRHFRYGSAPTYRDRWMPRAYLWPGINPVGSYSRNIECWKDTLDQRFMMDDGYVSTHQHVGLGHPAGWPFPTWWQAGIKGWHFSTDGRGYLKRVQEHLKDAPLRDTEGWEFHNLKPGSITDADGLGFTLTGPGAWMQPPAFEIGANYTPFVTIEWDLNGREAACRPWLEWTTKEHPEFSEVRRVYFDAVMQDWGPRQIPVVLVELYKHPEYTGTLTGYRIGFGNPEPIDGASLKCMFMTQDTRHNVNNANYVAGVHDFFALTGDRAFLQRHLNRARLALDYALKEFEVSEHGMVWTPWFGHDGRSGVVCRDGKVVRIRDRGIGNNYWDLLPFGGFDATATTYLLHAIERMADMEEAVATHADWNMPESDQAYSASELRALAERIRREASAKFWNEETGRLGCSMDVDGKLWDYGFTFVNNEAIFYGLTTGEQSRRILEWTTGERIVAGDTSQGRDIYRFRFAPRATTLRNEDYYSHAWTGFTRYKFGEQIQDGGAVFGLSYHDLMARLMTLGPDNAWERMREILHWYAEVQAEGGYREYYGRYPERGLLQSPKPGGLGVDREFGEPVLIPQFLLTGFAGFEPRMDGLAVHPRLPSDMPSLGISRVRVCGIILDLEVRPDRIALRGREGEASGLQLYAPEGDWRLRSGGMERSISIGRRGAVAFDMAPGETISLQRLNDSKAD